jgi:hypothetical protein
MSWVLIYIATNFLAPIPHISPGIEDFIFQFAPKSKNISPRISRKSPSRKKPAHRPAKAGHRLKPAHRPAKAGPQSTLLCPRSTAPASPCSPSAQPPRSARLRLAQLASCSPAPKLRLSPTLPSRSLHVRQPLTISPPLWPQHRAACHAPPVHAAVQHAQATKDTATCQLPPAAHRPASKRSAASPAPSRAWLQHQAPPAPLRPCSPKPPRSSTPSHASPGPSRPRATSSPRPVHPARQSAVRAAKDQK